MNATDAPRDLDEDRDRRMPPMGEILRRAGEPISPDLHQPFPGGAFPGGRLAPPQALAEAAGEIRPPERRTDPAAPVADVLAELARLIEHPPRVPDIGRHASAAMQRAFDTVVADVERLAQDGVDRAHAIQQEALSYSAVLRETGKLLCEKIETEATRAYQISMIMRTAQDRLQGPIPPPEPGNGG
jgi:hypothetical protein